MLTDWNIYITYSHVMHGRSRTTSTIDPRIPDPYTNAGTRGPDPWSLILTARSVRATAHCCWNTWNWTHWSVKPQTYDKSPSFYFTCHDMREQDKQASKILGCIYISHAFISYSYSYVRSFYGGFGFIWWHFSSDLIRIKSNLMGPVLWEKRSSLIPP